MNKEAGIPKKVWLLMLAGLLIPFFIIGMAFLAAKSDAENKRKYQQQRDEMQKKFDQQKHAASTVH